MRYCFFLPLLLLLLFAVQPAAAQRGLRAGVLGGGLASRLSGYDAGYQIENRYGAGYDAGLTVRYGFTEKLSLRLDARRARSAPRVWGRFRDYSNVPVGDGYVRRRFDWLTVPLLVQVLFSRGLYVLAGPTFQYLLHSGDLVKAPWTGITTLEVNDFTPQVRRVNVGAQVGGGIRWSAGRRGEGFAELTYAALAVQALRPVIYGPYNNDPQASSPVYPRPQPQAAWLRGFGLTVGVRFGAATD